MTTFLRKQARRHDRLATMTQQINNISLFNALISLNSNPAGPGRVSQPRFWKHRDMSLEDARTGPSGSSSAGASQNGSERS